MKKEIGQIETIGQAAKRYGVSDGTFQKRIQRAITDKKLSEVRDKLGIGQDVKTGLRSEFTAAMSELLSAAGWGDMGVVDDSEMTRSKNFLDRTERLKVKGFSYPEIARIQGNLEDSALKLAGFEPEDLTQKELLNHYEQVAEYNANRQRTEWEIKPEQKPDTPPMPSPSLSDPKPDTPKQTDSRTASDKIFKSEIIILFSLFVLVASDGFSMGLLAERALSDSMIARVFFSVVGLIVGYAGISTPRLLSEQPKQLFEGNVSASNWIWLFSIFQTALHGAAFDLFSGWDFLTWSEVVGRVLIVVSIPLATASLTTAILKR